MRDRHLVDRTPWCIAMIVILTLLMSGCAAHQYHDYEADIQRVQANPGIGPLEKQKQISDLQQQESDQQAQKVLDEASQQQWIPSEIIVAVATVALILGLIARRILNPPLTGAQLRAKTMAERSGVKAKAGAGKTDAKSGAAKPSSSSASVAPPASSVRPGASGPLAPSARSAAWEVPAAPVKVLEAGQAEVDAIPEDRRGLSFFTSRPLSLDHLVEIPLAVAGASVTVRGTQEEADAVRAGRIPRVRALSIEGDTRPWYQWPVYDAYRDYWAAEKADWVWKGGAIGASWMAIDRVDPALIGYLTPLPDRFGEPDEPEYAEPVSRRPRKAVTTLTARRLPHLKVRRFKAALAPAATEQVSRTPTFASGAMQKKTGFQQPWIYHARIRPKKAHPALFDPSSIADLSYGDNSFS